MRDEIDTELDYIECDDYQPQPKVIATSYIAYDFICECVDKIKSKIPTLDVEIYKIKNEFFGDKITVTGLICGKDIINQLKGKIENCILLLSESMFKDDEDIFLDDCTLEDVERELNVTVVKIPNCGFDFVREILK